MSTDDLHFLRSDPCATESQGTVSKPTSTIVSFDIGIKNLAYCVLVKEDDAPPIHIHDWNVINLMAQPNVSGDQPIEVVKCNCMVKGKGKYPGTVCGKPAKFRKEEHTFCGVHAKSVSEGRMPSTDRSAGWMMPKAAYTRSKLNARKKPELEAMATTVGLTLVPGVKSAYVDQLDAWFQARCLVPIQESGHIGAKDMDLITIGRNMCAHLDHIFSASVSASSLQITHVILENQISTLASRMKTIQGELTMYFLMKYPDAHIEYVSSTHKLRHFAGILPIQGTETTETKGTETKGTVYRQHKLDAIRITTHLLQQTPEWNSWKPTMLHKKKDDFADCFLQGLWYANEKL
jgi:hypothetical protein